MIGDNFKISKFWNSQGIYSKAIIIVILCSLVVAYLPTLQFDYVTQDQWRAFRYSLLEQSALERGRACSQMVWKFYFQTGRPLVWITECIEHAAVAKISDFIYIRPIMLAIVLITSVYLGWALSPILGSLVVGMIASSLFLVNPGYTYMYFQGFCAGMVLISVILAAASYICLRRQFLQSKRGAKLTLKSMLSPAILFFLACCIYPAWAFIVVPLVWLAFCFDDIESLKIRVKQLIIATAVYLVTVIFYYIYVKATVFILQNTYGDLSDVKNYTVTAQFNPTILWARVLELARFSNVIPLLNMDASKYTLLFLVFLFSVSAGYRENKSNNIGVLPSIALAIFVFIGTLAVLLISVVPWLFSQMDSLNYRHIVPWYLFFYAGTIGVLQSIVKMFAPRKEQYLSLFLVFMVLFPAIAIQNKLSFFEVAASNIEISQLRIRLKEWIAKQGYIKQRYLLFIRSTNRDRPLFIEAHLNGSKIIGENAVLGSSKNIVSIPWMINAVLREYDHPLGKSIGIVDCGLDQGCAAMVNQNTKQIALLVSDADVPIKSTIKPFVINISSVTANPAIPVVENVLLPSIKASSQFELFGPYGLLNMMQPGWHSERDPHYPQFLVIDFKERHKIKEIGFLPQDSGKLRGPKHIRVLKSNDGKKWVNIIEKSNICDENSGEGWHKIILEKQIDARYLKVEILSNCGDPHLLTLRGLKVK